MFASQPKSFTPRKLEHSVPASKIWEHYGSLSLNTIHLPQTNKIQDIATKIHAINEPLRHFMLKQIDEAFISFGQNPK